MANTTPTPAGQAKVYNRNVRIAKNAALVQAENYFPVSVTRVVVANGDQIDQSIFIANRPYKVIGVSYSHGTKGTDGGAVTVDVKKCTGVQAPSSGTSVLTSAFNAKGTDEEVQVGTLATNPSTLTLATGNRLALDYTGTKTALLNVTVSVDLLPV